MQEPVKFNMDTGCVELLLRDGRKISIDCTGVEDALDVTMAQQDGTGLPYLQLHEFLREILKAHCGVQHIQNSCLDFTQNLGKTGVQFMSGEVFFYICIPLHIRQ